jgi:hypothetical protein
MVNWYYVVGSERVGPVDVDTLKNLFLKDEINLNTYVWKKGFQNWERLSEVSELRFEENTSIEEKITPAPTTQVEINKVEKIEELASPEVKFFFDWNKVKDNDELFFVRIGKDRKNFDGSDIYGPYSRAELKEALEEKRVNFHTLIYSPGMSNWTKIKETPLNDNYNGINQSVGLKEVPLILVFNYSPLPLVTVVKKAGTKDGVLLGSGPFVEFENKIVNASLYVGPELKVKNIHVKIHGYNKKDQTIKCQFLDLNQDAKKIMLNHAV